MSPSGSSSDSDGKGGAHACGGGRDAGAAGSAAAAAPSAAASNVWLERPALEKTQGEEMDEYFTSVCGPLLL